MERTDVTLPRSRIYVTPHTNGDTEPPTQCLTLQNEAGQHHFRLLLTNHEFYTPERIQHCGGVLNCYNCTRVIEARIYFMPLKYENNIFLCDPAAHCRPECVRRTVESVPNNFDLKALLFQMYGEVLCAPPRKLLGCYVPGGYTLETYHAMLDEQKTHHQFVLVQEDTEQVAAFPCPLVVSATLCDTDTGQMVPSARALVDELLLTHRIPMGPERFREESEVITLPRKWLNETHLAQSWEPASASFHRSHELHHARPSPP